MTPCCDALFLHRGNRIDGELRCVGRGPPHPSLRSLVVRQVVQHLVGMGSRDQFRRTNHHHLSPTPRGVKYRD